ncbi:hypothetical protein BDN71DRAFT_1433447 [Pleurotus eryngii]|uniref:Uncharacterized protein n=1 Tax=Pleurotus eryngii TaxID=5323 RepID=A0A9P6D4D1_PLEER|nr:hypothetical protein BDN71DRAFT_1433447 [Pleurotus eryngii]
MTMRKPSGTAVPNVLEAASSGAPVANTPQFTMNPSVAITSAPCTQMGCPLNASIPATKGDPAPPLLGAVAPSVEMSSPIAPDTNKGKEKETPHAQGIVDLSYDLLKPMSCMSASQSKPGPKAARLPSASPTSSLKSLIPSRSDTPGSLLLGTEPENLFRDLAAMFGIIIEPALAVESMHYSGATAQSVLHCSGAKP